jgi:putative methyltransferase (TIGR04325 family)
MVLVYLNKIEKAIKRYFKAFLHNRKNIERNSIILYQGNIKSWEEALILSEGYAKPQILEKVREAVLKVKTGEAAYERDSVVFEKPQYPWPLIALLLKISIRYGDTLHVIDFGGSLGSTYFSCRTFLEGLKQWSWRVVEQEHFVTCGQKEVADENLHFFYSVEDALKENRGGNVLLLSSVLQYLPDPYDWLKRLLDFGFEYVLFDRTAFIGQEEDRLTLQYVPPTIYEAVYPAWFLNKENILKACGDYNYTVKFDFPSFVDNPLKVEDGITVNWEGMLLEKNNS